MGETTPLSLPPQSEDLESIKNNKSLTSDAHNRNLIKILEKDSKETEVFNEAEERLGIEMER